MQQSALEGGVADGAPLFLVMDNASIHHGAAVLEAVDDAAARHRVHIVYQPPYAPTMNPVELVNAQLKSTLKAWRPRADRVVAQRRRDAAAECVGKTDLTVMIDACFANAQAMDAPCASFYDHCGWRA